MRMALFAALIERAAVRKIPGVAADLEAARAAWKQADPR
jgi:hypothetical protein